MDEPLPERARGIARVLGTLVGLFMLMEFLEGLGYLRQLDTSGIVLRGGFFLVFAGCLVGWFKELVGALLILSGTVVIGVVSARTSLPFWVLIIPALVGFLYLFSRIGTRKK
jgi:hypothetical protein